MKRYFRAIICSIFMGSKRKSNSNSWISSSRKKPKTFYFSLENQMQLNPNKAGTELCIAANFIESLLKFGHIISKVDCVSMLQPVSKITDSTHYAFLLCSNCVYEYFKKPLGILNHLFQSVSKMNLHDEMIKSIIILCVGNWLFEIEK